MTDIFDKLQDYIDSVTDKYKDNLDAYCDTCPYKDDETGICYGCEIWELSMGEDL